MYHHRFFIVPFCILVFSVTMFADEIFVAKPAKKQSNSAIKETIVHTLKQLMREYNSIIREISEHNNVIISQIEDLAESQNFFAQADNKELAACAHHLEELCARVEKMRLELQRDMKQAFKSRKK